MDDRPIPGRIKGIEIDALDLIWQWQDEYKNSPSISELSRKLSRHRETTRDILRRLHAKGYIDLVQHDKKYRLLIVPLYRK